MTNTTSNRPTHKLYAVTKSKTPGGKGFWQEVGAVWPHEDGKGFNLKMDFMPLIGQELVIRELSTDRTEEARAAIGA
jgi:hypothetical protein